MLLPTTLGLFFRCGTPPPTPPDFPVLEGCIFAVKQNLAWVWGRDLPGVEERAKRGWKIGAARNLNRRKVSKLVLTLFEDFCSRFPPRRTPSCLIGLFSKEFSRGKTTHQGVQGNGGKRPIKANGRFLGIPPMCSWWKTAPGASKCPIKNL